MHNIDHRTSVLVQLLAGKGKQVIIVEKKKKEYRVEIIKKKKKTSSVNSSFALYKTEYFA